MPHFAKPDKTAADFFRASHPQSLPACTLLPRRVTPAPHIALHISDPPTRAQDHDKKKASTTAWSAKQWIGRPVAITAGTGVGQTRTVSSNTTNTLTVSPAWTTTPDGTSQYDITQTSTTLQDTTKTGPKAWTVNQWAGLVVTITAGTGAGQTRPVLSNTANTLTISPDWSTTPDGTSQYVITQTSNALQDVTKAWTTDPWAGRAVRIKAGTGA